MKKLIILLLCISVFVSSLSYADIAIRVKDEEELLQINPKYDRLRGILAIGFSAYFFYMGLQMSKGAKYEVGDVKLVGTCLLISSVPLFIWGITLTF